MLIDVIAGARPNFVKIAPILAAFQEKVSNGLNVKIRFIHTGQHFDDNMSSSILKQLNIPTPDYNLNAGSNSAAEQTGKIMLGYENILQKESSQLCIVVGDVTSTMACAITAKKNGCDVAHVEAGIRSGDMTMPEEINRIVTDSITDLFFTTSVYANKNLLDTGVKLQSIYFVGNVMIDTLESFKHKFRPPFFWDDFNLNFNNYFVLTLHRPANVDNFTVLNNFLKVISDCTKPFSVVFPVHPRTRNILNRAFPNYTNILFVEPLPYLEFNFLVSQSKGVITDSGGITEETTALRIPCITLRDSTERPETCSVGTNELIGTDAVMLPYYLNKILNNNWKNSSIPEKWDGKAAVRITDCIVSKYFNKNE